VNLQTNVHFSISRGEVICVSSMVVVLYNSGVLLSVQFSDLLESVFNVLVMEMLL
jgi:hypothetical protein